MYTTGSVRQNRKGTHFLPLSLSLNSELTAPVYHTAYASQKEVIVKMYSSVISLSHCPAYGVQSLQKTSAMITRTIPKSCS